MLASLSIIISNPDLHAKPVNDEIARFRGLVLGRLGLPYHERDLAVIVLVLDGEQDEINVLSGRIGKLPGVSARVCFAPEP